MYSGDRSDGALGGNGGGNPGACLGGTVKSILSSHMCREAIRDQLERYWSHTLDIFSIMQRILFNSVGNGSPLKEVCVCVCVCVYACTRTGFWLFQFFY